jgi:hypothetical protein
MRVLQLDPAFPSTPPDLVRCGIIIDTRYIDELHDQSNLDRLLAFESRLTRFKELFGPVAPLPLPPPRFQVEPPSFLARGDVL